MQVVSQDATMAVVFTGVLLLLVICLLGGGAPTGVPVLLIAFGAIGLIFGVWYAINFFARRRNRAIISPDGVRFVHRGKLKHHFSWTDIASIDPETLGGARLTLAKDGSIHPIGQEFFGSAKRVREFLAVAETLRDEYGRVERMRSS